MNEQIRTLNQIIAFGSALNAIPIGKNIAEFVFEGFKSINGITSCNVCLSFLTKPYGDIIDDKCKSCKFFENPDIHSCQLNSQDNIKILSVSTFDKKYGYIAIKTNQEFSDDLLPALHNFLNILTITIENHFQRKNIESTNSELQKHHQNLEKLVEEGTNELQLANNKLKIQNTEYWALNEEYFSQNEELKCINEELLIAKEKAENNEQSYRLLINSIPDTSILLFDKDLRYLILGGGEIEKSGFDKSLIQGKTLQEAYPKDVVDLFEPLYLKALKGEYSAFEMNYANHTYFQQVIPIYNSKKEIFAGTVIAQNITDRKKAEISLKQKNKEIEAQNEEYKQQNEELQKAKARAEESDRLKSAFLANMSHEIRTPMNGILGFSELLKEPKLSGEKQIEYINLIEKSGIRMLYIINDLIDISKVESGLMEVSVSKININEQIKSAYIFFKPEVDKKGLQIICKNTLPDNETIIKTDQKKFYAILSNLINNAIKYTNKGLIEFGYTKKDNHFEFYVKDTGIGIDKDKYIYIFERFVQANNEITRNYEGAGLGLAITKAYVEMLGGKIWLESVLGKGSIFYFTIPCNFEISENCSDKNKNIIYEAEKEKQINKLKILIVEDDITSALFLTEVVQFLSKEILHSKNGIEAIEACRNNPDLDLILVDIKVPEMNGYEAVKYIRQFNKKVIIIAQTAYAMADDREKALAAGCNDYITKPINKGLLTDLIKKTFN